MLSEAVPDCPSPSQRGGATCLLSVALMDRKYTCYVITMLCGQQGSLPSLDVSAAPTQRALYTLGREHEAAHGDGGSRGGNTEVQARSPCSTNPCGVTHESGFRVLVPPSYTEVI